MPPDNYVNHRSMTEFAACYGICKRSKSFVLTTSAGIALINGERHPDSIFQETGKAPVYKGRKPGNFLIVGIPVDMQIIRAFGNSFGMGLTSIANLNTEQSFFGILLSVYIGKIKT
ncbi:hypothetical protein JXQ31_16235 [candidate division KSB1 bacterium]|nr:hypothetical protein [candidate division KSB1 bacterium]